MHFTLKDAPDKSFRVSFKSFRNAVFSILLTQNQFINIAINGMHSPDSGRIQHPAECQRRGIAEFTFRTLGDNIQQLHRRILLPRFIFGRQAEITKQISHFRLQFRKEDS